MRQRVLSLPIPLRLLLAAQPKPVTPVLQVVHRVITRHLLGQAGLKAEEADSGGHADPTLCRAFPAMDAAMRSAPRVLLHRLAGTVQLASWRCYRPASVSTPVARARRLSAGGGCT